MEGSKKDQPQATHRYHDLLSPSEEPPGAPTNVYSLRGVVSQSDGKQSFVNLLLSRKAMRKPKLKPGISSMPPVIRQKGPWESFFHILFLALSFQIPGFGLHTGK